MQDPLRGPATGIAVQLHAWTFFGPWVSQNSVAPGMPRSLTRGPSSSKTRSPGPSGASPRAWPCRRLARTCPASELPLHPTAGAHAPCTSLAPLPLEWGAQSAHRPPSNPSNGGAARARLLLRPLWKTSLPRDDPRGLAEVSRRRPQSSRRLDPVSSRAFGQLRGQGSTDRDPSEPCGSKEPDSSPGSVRPAGLLPGSPAFPTHPLALCNPSHG
jgi:hypothetical protein